MAYVPNPTDPTRPTGADPAGAMYLEFQALKGYIQTLLAGSPNFSGLGSFRNRLANGGFNVAQRGTPLTVTAGASSASGYTLDQWIVLSVGAATTVSQVAGASAPFTNSKAIKLVQAAGGTSLTLQSLFEAANVPDMVVGAQVTVSGSYLTASIVTPAPTISLTTPTTGRDNWSGGGTIAVAAAQAVGVVVPQVAGVYTYFKNTFTLTSDGTNGLGIVMNWPNGATAGAIQLSEMQVEFGGYASLFEVRPVSVDTALCQRFYESVSVNLIGTGSVVGYVFGQQFSFAVTKRAAPSLAIVAAGTATNANTFTNVDTVSTSGFRAYATSTTATNAYITAAVVAAISEL